MIDQDIQSILATAYDKLAAISDTACLDAEILLCHCLGKPRTFLRAWPETLLGEAQVTQYRKLISHRQEGVPIAYITGKREFWSRDFKVSKNVLIPRPDTERLIELCLERIPVEQPMKLIDLGTGSGIIAITLAAERPLATITATDISNEALEIALDNAKMHQLTNINFKHSRWFDNIEESDFDLVISNPPYIAENDPHLQQGDVQHEPRSALTSPEQGLQDIRIIVDQARQHLSPKGHLLIEHGYNHQSDLQAIFKYCQYNSINTYNDLSGNPRVTTGIWNP